MPELPEVETVRKGLEKLLGNFYIKKIDVLKERTIASIGGSEIFINNIQNSYLCNWNRRGKYLISSLKEKNQNNKGFLVIHLRMTGQFKLIDNKIPPCSHTRVRFFEETGKELRFIDIRNFGQMWYVPSSQSISEIVSGIKRLGPEPFSSDFNSSYLRKYLKNKKRSIKSALLDQETVAGVGNIYADETLFDAGINPKTESRNLNKTELNRICNSLVKILKTSIGEGGTTFSDFRDLEGVNGNYGGQAWVYRRTGKNCKKCGELIMREKICGRSTHWCPNCQK
ncbi:DNA-formamidopyrimidine glycosylase [Prochlorococcus marinus]|uniref:Formamidopyrimidine-DNA glycosylase n=1 Tax=Prochlorococcus marinus XMU1408 TaxID=2213228 RepID=A0A318R2U1_PROMR|nr:DNA-formamidopyrimidine glycosylase [Prochlorococcus marinus]MBW3041396.1 DNA-formamidopyrimidine glycosylase [Prochlorococcus marinus str. XMU1408]PYE02560.1 DNA-formamidopyrimidine glycosylase [Prochlorococcus marinus XMU1408]